MTAAPALRLTARWRPRTGRERPSSCAPEFNAQVLGGVLQDMDWVVYGVGLPEQFALDTGVFDRVNRGILTKFCRP